MSVECPIWYTRLSPQNKDNILRIIGDARQTSTILEDMIIDMMGITRDDAQIFLRWWFLTVSSF